jgi:hypothetical protein
MSCELDIWFKRESIIDLLSLEITNQRELLDMVIRLGYFVELIIRRDVSTI